MSRSQRFRRAVGLAVAMALFVASLPLGVARAGLVTTDRVIEETMAAAERERIVAILQRDDVRQQLAALGVEADEAVARVASLSDEEIQQIAGRIDELPAGQSALAGVLIAAGVIVVALIITDFLGITDVFTFIRGRP